MDGLGHHLVVACGLLSGTSESFVWQGGHRTPSGFLNDASTHSTPKFPFHRGAGMSHWGGRTKILLSAGSKSGRCDGNLKHSKGWEDGQDISMNYSSNVH